MELDRPQPTHSETDHLSDNNSGSDDEDEGSVVACAPLTTQDRRCVLDLADAYARFWASGAEASREVRRKALRRTREVEDLLLEAAEYVVRIRKHLDAQKRVEDGYSSSVRLLEGSAHEYFWALGFRPAQDPRRFVVGLVHATFKNAGGYVEGLSEAVIDEYIAEIDDYYENLPLHDRRHPARCRAGRSNSRPQNQQQNQDKKPDDNDQHMVTTAKNDTTTENDSSTSHSRGGVLLPLQPCVVSSGAAAVNWPLSVEGLLNQARQALSEVPAEVATAKSNTEAWVSVCKQLERVNTTLGELLGQDNLTGKSSIATTPCTPKTPGSGGGSLGRRRRKSRKAAAAATAAAATTATTTTTTSGDVISSTDTTIPTTTTTTEMQCDAVQENDAVNEHANAAAKAPILPSEGDASPTPTVTTPAPAALTPEPPNADSIVPPPDPSSSAAMEVDKQPPAPSQSQVDIQVGRTSENVQKVQGEVQNLIRECHNLDMALASKDADFGEKVVQQLQKKALVNSELLMRDFLSLDQLVCGNAEEREKRKKMVHAIQSILDDVDTVNEKLHHLQQVIAAEKEKERLEKEKEKQQQKEEEELERTAVPQEEKEEEQSTALSYPPSGQEASEHEEEQERKEIEEEVSGRKSPRKRQQAHENPHRSPKPPTSAAADRQALLLSKLSQLKEAAYRDASWRDFELEPKFQVSQQGNAFVAQAYIPNMRKSDISVDLSEDGKILVIQGFRMPSKAELDELFMQLCRQLTSGRLNERAFLELPAGTLLRQLAAGGCGGRYGSFRQRYELPPDADRAGIHAAYSSGTLTVTVPLLEHGTRRQPFYNYQHPLFRPFDQETSGGYPECRSRTFPFMDDIFSW